MRSASVEASPPSVDPRAKFEFARDGRDRSPPFTSSSVARSLGARPPFEGRSSGAADCATLSTLWSGGKRYDLNRGAGRRQMFGFLALCPGFDVKLLSWKAEVDARDEVRA